MQTTPSVKDMRDYLDGSKTKTPERSPERSHRASTPSLSKDIENLLSSPVEKTPTRNGTPTPSSRDFLLKDPPQLRPSSRPPPRAILGENGSPQSQTVLAMQNMTMKSLEPPLGDITNASSPKGSQNLDALSVQIQSLTQIASSLQKEMSNLSRRSKDNATDLISLKEATNQRDEDIRTSLKELVSNVSATSALFSGSAGAISRSGSALSEKPPHLSTPTARKSFSLPRVPSPNSFIIDDIMNSPNPYSIEGAASVAMLEKIIREMVTKEGQDRLTATLSKLIDKASQESNETAKKMTELVEFIRDGRQSQALIRHNAPNGPVTRSTLGDMASRFETLDNSPDRKAKATEFVSSEMLDLLKKIKDSVASSGGLTAEVKALVRDLKGEVLGMGRELGRRFEEVDRGRSATRSIEGSSSNENDVAQIVSQGLMELKHHMEQVIRENRRQSSSTSLSRSSVDNQEVYEVVKHALAQSGLDRSGSHEGISKDDILSAVKEAYESYRPEIELQQFGLERDEILQCLKEGLEGYRANSGQPSESISREEVFVAIQDAMKDVQLPRPPTEAQEVREEMLAAFKDCLEELKPQLAPDMQVEIDQDAIIEAVRQGMEGTRTPFHGYGEQVMGRLEELVTDMRSEFKSYSSANGRDTEQVLDAVKDGLENLRREIESYVDRAQDVTGKDEIIDEMRHCVEGLRADIEGWTVGDRSLSKAEILDYIKSEFEHLHATIDPDSEKSKAEILEAVKLGIANLNFPAGSRGLDGEVNGESQEALKEEIEQLKAAVLDGSSSHKTEIMTAIEAGFASMGGAVALSNAPSQSHEEIIAFIKEELDHMRETLATTMVRSGGPNDKEDIIDALRESMESLKSSLGAEGQVSSNENLAAIQEELSRIRETMGGSLVQSGSQSDKEDILEALRSGLHELSLGSNKGVNDEAFESVRTELEQIRQAIATGLAQRNQIADTDEIVDTVRVGLDDMRSELLKKLDNPERFMTVQGDIIDALNEGIDSLKSEVNKAVDRPVDMTVTYEILDTLKEGIAGIRDDLANLKIGSRPTTSGTSSSGERSTTRELAGNEVVLAEDPASVDGSKNVGVPKDVLCRNDLEKMEIMLAQLQIKVETMDANIHNPQPPPASEPAPGSALKEDLVGIEQMLKDLQDSVSSVGSRAPEADEDSEAIETLLRNTKAKIDELNFPDSATLPTKEQVETLEGGLKAVNDAVDAVAAKVVEDGATKADVAVVEVLVSDLKGVVDEIKDTVSKESDTAEAVTKADIDVIGVLCTELKIRLEEMKLPEPDSLPQQADIEQLRGLIHDFRDSHDKFKESYESDISITAKAFDDRKQEAVDFSEKIADVRTYLEELKEEVTNKLSEGTTGVEVVSETVKGLEATIASNFNINADVKELMETVNREFERAQGSIEGLKADADDKTASQIEKFEEIKAAIMTELTAKVEEKFDALMSKYDDAQSMAEAHIKMMEEKSTQQEEVLNGTKVMAEDLKLTIDTLGTTITGLNNGVTEATEKMSQDSQTVFERIDQSFSKMNENHDENKEHHQDTKTKVAEAFTALTALQSDVTEFHPRFMTSLQEVLAVVNQHYQHSQKAQETARDQLREAADLAKAHTEEIKTTFSGLPALLPPPLQLPPPPEKFDDAPIQAKLDDLLAKTNDPAASAVQLELLDKIHQQVMNTAAEVTAFVNTQTKLITEGHESKEKEAEEVALLLERRLGQKEHLEQEIKGMNDEKESLRQAVETLRREREELANQKSRLNADVSALQMALNIRCEELRAMDDKAEKLERRILEGIMDHSRALLIAKSAAKNPLKPKPQRAPSNISQNTISTSHQSAAANGLSMALKPRPAMKRGKAQAINGADRRIFSLSKITGNVPTGAQAYAPANKTGLVVPALSGGLKRSQSVKNPPNYARKSSWSGRHNSSRELDKENQAIDENGVLSEEDENNQLVLANPAASVASTHDIHLDEPENHHEYASDAGTERRHSIGSIETFDHSVVSPSEDGYMYGSSYLTGSDMSRSNRSISYGSTIRSTLGPNTAIDEEDEDESDVDATEHGVTRSHHAGDEHSDTGSEASSHYEDEEETRSGNLEVTESNLSEAKDVLTPLITDQDGLAAAKKLIVAPSENDSGLGTDLPSAAINGPPTGIMSGESEGDYFRRMAEEEESVVSSLA